MDANCCGCTNGRAEEYLMCYCKCHREGSMHGLKSTAAHIFRLGEKLERALRGRMEGPYIHQMGCRTCNARFELKMDRIDFESDEFMDWSDEVYAHRDACKLVNHA